MQRILEAIDHVSVELDQAAATSWPGSKPGWRAAAMHDLAQAVANRQLQRQEAAREP